jgi:N-acetylglucosaminyl-diphospho-decaprenol L-rhamnosyltransferase
MAATAPSMSVTIVNHSSRVLLRSCLNSLVGCPYTLGEMQIVVIDNASQDGSVEMLSEEFPSVVVIAADQRRGFGENQNKAIAASTGAAIFLLNPDATVHAGTLDRLVTATFSDSRIAAAGGSVLNGDGSVRQDALHRFEAPLTPFGSAIGLDRLRPRHTLRGTITGSGWPSGGACLVRRDVFDALGGFDESFFMYSEDTDLFARIVESGHKIAWVADATVTHPFPDESTTASSRREVEKIRSSTRYMRKHYGYAGAVIHRIAIATDAASRIMLLSMPGLSGVLKTHGRTSASLRRRYGSRLRYIVWPVGGQGLAESAAAWNAAHRPAPRSTSGE